MSTQRRSLGVYSSPAPRGAAGEKLCRNCLGPLPKGRRHNCSNACSEAWIARTSPAYMRRLVYERDHGICAGCGVDCLVLKAEYDGMSSLPREEREIWLRAHGIPYGRAWGDLWDADHITPVVEGGGECTLENMRTLCIPCHHKETAELARRRARERHIARPLPLFDQVSL